MASSQHVTVNAVPSSIHSFLVLNSSSDSSAPAGATRDEGSQHRERTPPPARHPRRALPGHLSRSASRGSASSTGSRAASQRSTSSHYRAIRDGLRPVAPRTAEPTVAVMPGETPDQALDRLLAEHQVRAENTAPQVRAENTASSAGTNQALPIAAPLMLPVVELPDQVPSHLVPTTGPPTALAPTALVSVERNAPDSRGLTSSLPGDALAPMLVSDHAQQDHSWTNNTQNQYLFQQLNLALVACARVVAVHNVYHRA